MPNPLQLLAQLLADRSAQEQQFQAWYAMYASRLGINPDPDNPRHFYDWRAAYQAGAAPDSQGHWPSQFKREGHPNLIVNDIDTRTGEPAPRRNVWQQFLKERPFDPSAP